jgi:hypothetical protein
MNGSSSPLTDFVNKNCNTKKTFFYGDILDSYAINKNTGVIIILIFFSFAMYKLSKI